MRARHDSLSQQHRLGRLIAGAAASLAVTGAAIAVVLGATAAASGQQTSAAPNSAVRAVESIGITVSDLDRSVGFYTDVLSFERIGERESADEATEHFSGVFGARCRTARLRLGDETIELTQFLAPEGRQIPADSRSNDRWFQHIAIVVSDMNAAYAQLRKHNIRHASSGPQTLPDWNQNAGGISAFYFKDPDGHVLEVIHFPNGKGDPKWQRPSNRLFLGIDHTAIVVGDTDRSLAFYSGTLGMRIVGASENYGTEQEHLNNVFGARLRITALRAPQGPGIELLEYLAPTDGRPMPTDLHANDLAHWHTTLVTPDAAELTKRLRNARTAWVSPGFVSGVSGSEFITAAQIRDPDGHAVVIGQTSRGPQAATPQ
jgi:catechol 2,3-dioxygenase-like lactoylglutathione lyase family enzyme